MWIHQIQISKLKSFDNSGLVTFSPGINVIVGKNNTGKSTILQAILQFQSPNLSGKDIRKGATEATIDYHLDGIEVEDKRRFRWSAFPAESGDAIVRGILERNSFSMIVQSLRVRPQLEVIEAREPQNWIYPFLAKRKVVSLNETINIDTVNAVSQNLVNLYAIVDKLMDRNHPSHDEFVTECHKIIGFPISTFPSDGGKQSGRYVDANTHISLDSMGEGVSHILALIARLCVAKRKLFVIEEIENDIHPQALKGLLELIVQKSNDNQFILSSHSNIVTTHLGSAPGANVFNVECNLRKLLPASSIRLISDDPQDRQEVLESLGYELADYGLWSGWLFLEESSAERLIRDYFLRWYSSGLVGRLRTVASTGVSEVGPKFDSFNRLFLFTHLEPMYRNRAWVLVDSGKDGSDVIKDIKAKFTEGWTEDRFRLLSKKDFELYYPAKFSAKVTEALSLGDKKKKRQAKKALLHEVIDWIGANEQEARLSFEESAGEIVGILREIELALGLKQLTS
jgi:predicted ATPase